MGLGYYLTEELIYDPQTGALANNSTWVNSRLIKILLLLDKRNGI